MTSVMSLSEYFGFDCKSPYAQLFTDIYHLTKPKHVETAESQDTR